MQIPVRATAEGHFGDSIRAEGDVFLIQDKQAVVYKKNSNVPERGADGKVKYKTITAKQQFSHVWMQEISMEQYMEARNAASEDGESDEAPIDLTPNPDANQGDEVSSDQINEVLRQLDPENDAHWTSKGLPAMEAVEDLGGFEAEAVKRSDVTAANPAFNRDLARAQRVNAE